jgi:hypothetical protein
MSLQMTKSERASRKRRMLAQVERFSLCAQSERWLTTDYAKQFP